MAEETEMAHATLAALFSAQTSRECLAHATELANHLKRDGLHLLQTTICPALLKAAKDKKDGVARESALIAFSEIFVQYPPSIPHLLQYLPVILDAGSDKGQVVRDAADLALRNLLRASEAYVLSTHVLPATLSYLEDGSVKWQSRICALTLLEGIAEDAPERMGEKLENVVPVVAACIHDTKSQVSDKATITMKKVTDIVQNNDLHKSMPHILLALSDPSGIKECIRALSHTTFVAEVGPPTLALLVPLLKRSMMDAAFGVNTQRQTAVVVDNLVRLVPDPTTCTPFLKALLPGVKRVAETASMPEVRALATRALATLQAAGAETPLAAEPLSIAEVEKYLSSYVTVASPEDGELLHAVAAMVADMIAAKDYFRKTWEKTLAKYMSPIMTGSPLEASKQIYAFFWEDYKLQNGLDTPVTGEIPIVDTDFSLAYGGMMLLNKTNLKLFRGHRYGVCAHNGAGKSTLLRAISEGKVEGFPSADELTPFFVEHKLQGAEGDLSVYAFVKKDFPDKTQTEVEAVLLDVGFEPERQQQNVGALSGGWKMKLELARAMMSRVDILLLDEPTNHLDTTNVAWLQDYLNSQTQITSVIVSHDSGFLDAVCTDIIHYESKKLAYYPGNLSKFVERKPEAKSYYTLSSTQVAFSFPPPGLLTGISSRTKAILRLRDCTFTYPGVDKPSLKNVSAALSLSSRIGIIGKNGAGKSTFIKVLTGEVIPQQGTVEKHPNLRVGYVAQHSLHHVDQHVHLTPNQYIQWRYQFGEDKEVLEKETRKISETDEEIEIEVTNPKTGKLEKRKIEYIVGRQKLKKSFQYEIKWRMMEMRHNMWLPREKLVEQGATKLIQRFDDWEAGREGLGSRDLNPVEIRKHLESVGLDGDIADNNEIGGLSGGQKVKVVIAACMWAKPHLLVLDEPTNYLDRDSLGGLAVAIRDWTGGVVMISHNDEFVSALCPERWTIADGAITQQGKSSVDANKFEDGKAIGGEKAAAKLGKKKKLSRNQLKERDARRRLRHLAWLSSPPGTPRPDDSDTD
ncbi:P-loop containing nucleoside triphosphate hydrolase protein [Protomyces lactucae-debilis]|uniref:p-loop containing nucleoside triphosphate hydrolase protein n=1 Tax=Protomyces lactucae-debilis TaxID=2754530 RepID=A0A1Y2FER5_PROLT|nr:P-loop containing nucleoside triphosphate hydrolase protein [Protomyces lactucae-debilis]ORY81325.1 P-loop containing nucleoside triphosphate hydrolase protein [Protomyces lactucae-debilis]